MHTLLSCVPDSTTRLQKYHEKYPCYCEDSEEEETQANNMFIDDLNGLRKVIESALLEALSLVFETEKKFTSERTFFMKQLKEAEAKQKQTQDKLLKLESEFALEREHNKTLLVDEHIEKLC